MSRVLVTGIGVVSAIGNDKQENLQSLREGKTGIRKAQYVDSKYCDSFPFAEVPISNAELKKQLNVTGEKGLTRTELLAFKALDEAFADSGLSRSEISSARTAFFSGSTIGGMVQMHDMHKDANLIGEGTEFVDSFSCGMHLLFTAKRYGFKGVVSALNTACSSSANAIMQGVKLIRSGRADRAIVGGSDCLAKFAINGFNSLGILSSEPCQPFDANRKGLNLGEGAAFLVLEREDIVGGKNVYAEIAGFGNSNDAHHPSSMSEDAKGASEAMRKALETAKVKPEDVDYINTHGTATENNDVTELQGIKTIFGTVPPYNSTKSLTGHTLGASGALEAIYSILSINNGELYPSLNCSTPIEPYNELPVMEHRSGIAIRTVLSNSFGFAGNCSSLVIKEA